MAADIINIDAPKSAKYLETVTVVASLRNTDTAAVHIAATGKYDETVLLLKPDYLLAAAGGIYGFSASFTMPNENVRVRVWSWRWTGTEWHQENYAYVDVASPAKYKGAIVKKELEYNGSRTAIPVLSVLQGKSALVHVWGRNDCLEAKRMGVSWVVRDPDGIIVEQYSTWEEWPYTGAGKEHEFIGGRFSLNKVGVYTVGAGLIMNPDDVVYVDTYYGNLCVVVAELVPTFSEFTITDYLGVV